MRYRFDRSNAEAAPARFGPWLAAGCAVVAVPLALWMQVIGSRAMFPVERELSFDLPSSFAPMVALGPTTPVITIASSGDVVVGDHSHDASTDRDLPALRALLRERFKDSAIPDGVIVNPDASAPFQRIIDVLSAIEGEKVPLYNFGSPLVPFRE